jgi:hypothetical protein
MEVNMKLTIYITTAVMLTSCAMSKPTYLSDGTQGHSISCDGSAVGMNVCFEKAGELCGSRGYNLLNKAGQVVYSGMSSGSASVNAISGQAQGFAFYGGFNTKSILIQCK